jgi:hypothetical protein
LVTYTCWGLGKDCEGWKCRNDWIQFGINRLQPIIEKDIDTWFHFYGDELDGIFFDEVSIDPAHLQLYSELINKVRSLNQDSKIVNNYGMTPPDSYLSLPDTIHCILEQRFSPRPRSSWAGYKNWHPKSIQKIHETCLLLHATNQENFKNAILKAQKDKFNWIYITDASGDNPWGTIPSYFDELTDFLLKNQKSSWLKNILPF